MKPGLLIAFLGLVSGSAAAQETAASRSGTIRARNAAELAERIVAAFQSGDDDAIEDAASHSTSDPYLVADILFDRHGHDRLAEPPRPSVALDAATAFAEALGENGEAGGLRRFVAGWASYTREELEDEARLRTAVRDLLAMSQKRAFSEAVARGEAERTRAARARPSVASVRLLHELANAYGYQELDREAEPVVREMRERAAKLGWPGARARAAMLLAGVLDRRQEIQEARSIFEEAATLGKPLKDRRFVSMSAEYLSIYYRRLGLYARSLEFCELSLREHRAMGDHVGSAAALMQTGYVHLELGRDDRMLEAWEASAKEGDESNDASAHVDGLLALGVGYFKAGIRDRAIRFLETALERARAAKLPFHVRSALSSLGSAYFNVGRIEEARAAMQAAVDDDSGPQDPQHTSAALADLGRLHASRGDRSAALTCLLRALEASKDVEDGATRAFDREYIARTLASIDRIGEARAVLAETIDLERAIGDRGGEAKCLRTRAELDLKDRRLADAVESSRASVLLRLATGEGLGEGDALGLRSEIRGAADIGLFAAAELAREKEGGGIDATAVENAFWFAEAGRALLLAGSLANRAALKATHVPLPLLEEEAKASARVEAARRALQALTASKSRDGDAVLAARRNLDLAYRGLEDAGARIERSARRVAGVVYPRPVSLADLRAILPEDAAFVSFNLIPDGNLALVVTRAGARVAPLPERDVAAMARSYVLLASVPGSDEAGQAAALYDALVRPVEALIVGKTRLLVSADAELTFVPFEALIRKADGTSERLLERLEVDYVPSATVFSTLLAETRSGARGQGLLALGDPVYPSEAGAVAPALPAPEDARRDTGRLQRLPATGEEVRVIAELFPADRRRVLLRSDANVGALKAALGKTRTPLLALHLACHGEIDTERPRLTGLVVAGGETLTVDDVYQLEVQADVAVLSACETARGAVARGEGVLGLVRAFFFAGAPRVVVSDWKVADASTRELMIAFYRRLVKGLPPGVALREAKLERLRAGGAAAHPFHWAAFVLYGLGK